MEDFIYTNSTDGFLKEKGLFLLKNKVFEISYFRGILKINNKTVKTTRPLPILEKLIRKHKLYGIGFISYDYKDMLFPRTKYKKIEMPIPYIYFKLYKNVKKISEDYLLKKTYNSKTEEIIYPDKLKYISSVYKALDYISSGDIYQINITHRVNIKGFINYEKVFYNLIKTQPTPYMMLLQTNSFKVISSSMELFLEKNNHKITTKPIKGTAPRGKTKEEDSMLFQKLKNSPKEKAENLMITDLMRNDLGKISQKASVKVEELFKIEKYKTLYQMHSTISSILKKGITFEEIIHSTFPAGSITGAPKKRAIEIIDELEPYKRYNYCGANFFIKPDMNFVSSVAIRQIINYINDNYIYIGAGIVANSIPEKEYEETILKAKANIDSILNT